MPDIVDQLQLYFEASEDQARKLATYFKREILNRNDFHTIAGQRYGKLSFVAQGYLRVYRETETKEITQWIASPGEFCTDLACLLMEQPARWNIQCLSEVELWTLDYAQYRSVQEKIESWSEIERSFLVKCFITMEERIFSFLSLNAEERFEYFSKFKPDLLQQVPQQYLASLLGMTPETYSRIRRKIVS